MVVAKEIESRLHTITYILFGCRFVCDGNVALLVTFCAATTSDLTLSQAAPGFPLPQHGYFKRHGNGVF